MNIFVCSPYGGTQENYDKALIYCDREKANGNTPFAPHVLCHGLLDEKTLREQGLMIGFRLMQNCQEVHVYGLTSPGMAREIDFATDNNIPVKYMEG
jgi:hypothetical protein